MLKALGTLLLLAGTFLLRQKLTSPRKARLAALWELSQALAFLARGIASTRTPMPRLLQTRGFGGWGDGFFAAVYEGAFEQGKTLPDSWQAAACALPLSESERQELSALGGQFSESAAELGKKVAFCSETLHGRWENAQRECKEREKTEGPLCLCGALLFVILLI